MKIAIVLCMLGMALFVCKTGTDSGNSNSSSNSSSGGSKSGSGGKVDGVEVEHPNPSAAQTSAVASGHSVKWDQQGITWTLPEGWKESENKKESFMYSSPDNAFLIVSVSVMSDDFPMDASLSGTYKQATDMLKQGKYEEARLLEIDGLAGAQFRESMPEDKDGPRRMQWIAMRKYAGQVQQVNVMLSTRGDNFAKHQDEFYGILYSMKVIHD